jgi:hypothetical protein
MTKRFRAARDWESIMQAKTAMMEVRRVIQKAGPYVVMEIVLPGGTLFALLLYLHRTGQLRKLGQVGGLLVRGADRTFGALAFALQPAGHFDQAHREHGLELQTLAASR